jgi:transposase InsO family protein
MQEMPCRPTRRATQRGNETTEGKLESRIHLKVSVRFGGKFSETWHGDMSRRTVLTLQGVQYAATAYTQALQDVNVQISMADVGEAWQNGYAERLIRTVKEEEVDLSEYIDYNDAYRQLGRFLDQVYMHKRIHSSLGYLTPAEFEEQWRKEQTRPSN